MIEGSVCVCTAGRRYPCASGWVWANERRKEKKRILRNIVCLEHPVVTYSISTLQEVLFFVLCEA